MDKDTLNDINNSYGPMFDKIKDSIVHESNPKVLKKLKGTKYQNEIGLLKKDAEKVLLNINSILNDNFEKAWLNLFKSSNINPFKKPYMSVKNDYVNDSLTLGNKSLNAGYATNWLKFNLMTDRDGKRKL